MNVAAALFHALALRDEATAVHSLRVVRHVVQLGRAFGLAGYRLRTVTIAALLHDVGKLAIPDSILQKPGPLSATEKARMQMHAHFGFGLLKRVGLTEEAHIVRHVHERWDGMGYPDGLAGPAIPLASRLVAVADAYDAMTSIRPYRSGLSHVEAMRELLACAGRQFDPEVVSVFLHGTQALDTLEVFR